MKLVTGRLYFIVLPVLTMAVLWVTYTDQEPFPTLVMPGFAPATNLDDVPGFERSMFVVGSDESGLASVTAMEFTALDFTQPQSLPIFKGIRRELPDLDQETDDWIHDRLARIVPDRCGELVGFTHEMVRVDGDNDALVVEEVIESYELGALRCSD